MNTNLTRRRFIAALAASVVAAGAPLPVGMAPPPEITVTGVDEFNRLYIQMLRLDAKIGRPKFMLVAPKVHKMFQDEWAKR